MGCTVGSPALTLRFPLPFLRTEEHSLCKLGVAGVMRYPRQAGGYVVGVGAGVASTGGSDR